MNNWMLRRLAGTLLITLALVLSGCAMNDGYTPISSPAPAPATPGCGFS